MSWVRIGTIETPANRDNLADLGAVFAASRVDPFSGQVSAQFPVWGNMECNVNVRPIFQPNLARPDRRKGPALLARIAPALCKQSPHKCSPVRVIDPGPFVIHRPKAIDRHSLQIPTQFRPIT